MPSRKLCWGVLVLFAIGGVLGGGWRFFRDRSPQVVYPRSLDLGAQAFGDIAVGRLRISNNGREDLLIDQIHTDCSCAGLERLDDGQHVRFETLRIPSRTTAELVVRVAIRETPGKSFRTTVRFRTNDPRQPIGQIEILVPKVVGLSASPTSVVFGDIMVRASAKQVVELRGVGENGYRLESVDSSAPEVIQARLLPPDSFSDLRTNDQRGRLIGKIIVEPNTSMESSLDAIIRMHLVLDGRLETKEIRTSGRAVQPIVVSPSRLSLPRSSDGGLVYTATCICRHILGKPIKVEVTSTSPGVSAFVTDRVHLSASCLVQIQLKETLDEFEATEKTVKLRALDGEREHSLSICIDRSSQGGKP